MSIEENKAFIRKYLEVFSGKDKPKELLEQYTSDPELIEQVLVIEAAFPKFENIVDEMIAEGDWVCIFGRFRGVHKGDLNGIPPTGKQVENPTAVFYRLAEGKIAKGWIFRDRMRTFEQLGVLPG